MRKRFGSLRFFTYRAIPWIALTATGGLRAVRTIIESPFAEERGKVWYFAGHGAERKLLHNTAWIYKGTLTAPEKDKP
jgi:hypothetical protein